MAAMPSHGSLDDHRLEYMGSARSTPRTDELAQARKENELLKASNPFRVVEMAIEIQVERMRVVEAMSARDAAIQRLSDAYVSIRQKTEAIEHLRQELEGKNYEFPSLSPRGPATPELAETSKLKEEVCKLESLVKDLREEIRSLKKMASANVINRPVDPPSWYEEGTLKTSVATTQASPSQTGTPSPGTPALTESGSNAILGEQDRLTFREFMSPIDLVRARYDILSTIPIPAEAPDDTLSPIIIPPPYTLHEFLGSASGALRISLSNYRILQSLTTVWCPDREEHGYFYAPVFKCSTNPRVATAHRWSSVDVVARMSKPTECFYNKDGTWYYAGVYTGFKLDDLTVKEWAELPTETTQAIIKDTIAGRKNTSPQNVYETGQLYASGALKVACVGLQCVGFNREMYTAILEQADKFAQIKWKGVIGACSAPSTAVGGTGVGAGAGGLGTGSTLWNSQNTGDLVEGIGGLSLGNENASPGEESRGKR